MCVLCQPPPSTLCGACYPWTFPDVPVRSWPNNAMTATPLQCISGVSVGHALSLSPCLMEFKQSSYFLESSTDWPEENEQSRREHGGAEVSQLQGSNLVRNFEKKPKFLPPYKFQLQAVNKHGCLRTFSFLFFFFFSACKGICFVSDFVWNAENRLGLDKQCNGKDSCAITRWGAGTNDRAAG